MDPQHKNIIRRNYLQLADSMQTDIDKVCSSLWSATIFTDTMREDILQKSTPRKKAEALLDLVMTRGPKAFEALYESVMRSELFDAADILKPDKKPHWVDTPENGAACPETS